MTNPTQPKLHALSYRRNDATYAITLEGSHEEAHAHARNLGLTYEGEIVEQIPVTDEEMRKIE